ncbi:MULTISPECIES: helix-turn-helix domain-containing protein [unclassified Blastococcus]
MPPRERSPISYVISGSWDDGTAVFDTGDAVFDEALQRYNRTAKTIRERRKALDWSFETVGRRAGKMRRQTVSELESGQSWPDAVTVHRIAIALGFDSEVRDDPQARPYPRPAAEG